MIAVAIDVSHLPSAAEGLGDLSQSERDVLGLLAEGLGSRDIAERLSVDEAAVYLVIADLISALEYQPPATMAEDIHQRAGTRAATAEEISRFHEQFGPLKTDNEG